MAIKRRYDANTMRTEYERTLELQKQRETTAEEATQQSSEEPRRVNATSKGTAPEINNKVTNTHIATEKDEPYVDPDYEDYKRISLFMDFDTWERLMAICWKKGEAINKTVVDHLRDWGMELGEDELIAYRAVAKEKNLKEWERRRNIMIYWWRTSGIREQLNIKSYRVHRNGTLTVIELNDSIREYSIVRGYISDGKNKFARVKTIEALMKRQ